MARMKITPHKGEGRKDEGMMMRAWMHVRTEVKTRRQVLVEAQGPPSLAQETPPDPEEIIRRIAEAEWLEEGGRSSQSLPTQQLAQMAVEAGPSKLGGEEPAHKKL